MSYCLVFVYGTLKRNEPNHHWLTDAENGCSRFICRAKTVETFPLVIASRYNIPYLLNAPGSGNVSNLFRLHQLSNLKRTSQACVHVFLFGRIGDCFFTIMSCCRMLRERFTRWMRRCYQNSTF